MWRDELLNASFRDAPFFVERVSGSFGRRVVLHEFPGLDEPYPQDLGRRSRRFTFTAFVLGPDYMAARDKLIEAFETAGPGKLVHPYRGILSVVVDGEVTEDESSAEGGLARFSGVFVEAGELPVPELELEPIPDAEVVASSLAESFAAVVSFTAEVTAVYADGVTRLQAVTSAMRQTLRKVQGVIDTVESVTATIKEVEADVAGLLALPGQLATSVVNAYKALGQAIAGINDAVSSALDTFGLGANTDELARRAPTSGGRLSARHRADLLANLLVDASSFGADLPVIAETTSSRVQLNTNRRAFERLVKVGTLIGVSTGLAQPGMTFEDRDQILTLRDAVSDAVDDLLADPELDDDLFNALRDLQVTVHGYLSRLVVALPDLMLYTSPGTIPTLVVAHQLYQDPEREFELIARNPAIHHPGFVPGGEALRVLDV